MKISFFASFIIFCLWLGYEIHKHRNLEAKANEDFWEKEAAANATRRKSLDSLNYIEIPLVLKYKYNIDPHFSLQPFFGGYFALGVGGKIKNFEQREAQNSFNDDNFRRVDGGLRLGCGVQYDMVYADLTYDIGLANICHDTFDTSHNGGLQLNFGVNF